MPRVNPVVLGAGISKEDEVNGFGVMPETVVVKVIVAPETAAPLVADKLVKVPVPLVTLLPVPKFHAPTGDAETVPMTLVAIFSY